MLLYPEGMVKLLGQRRRDHEARERRPQRQRPSSKIWKRTFPGVDLRDDVIEFLEVAHGNGWIRVKQA